MEQRGPAYLTRGQFTPHALGGRDQPEAVQNARYQAYEMRKQSMEQHNKVQWLRCPCHIFKSQSDLIRMYLSLHYHFVNHCVAIKSLWFQFSDISKEPTLRWVQTCQ